MKPLALLAVLVFVTPLADERAWGSEPADYRCCIIPLVSPYAIVGQSREPAADIEKMTFKLAEANASGESRHFLEVPAIEEVAVVGDVIVGRTLRGHFLLDTRRSGTGLRLFNSPEEWRSALAAAGIPAGVQLRTPQATAAGLPQRVLRPWNFRVMRGLFGWSDDGWSLIVQVAGLMFVFVLGLASAPDRPAWAIAVTLGIVVNVVAEIVIAGGGPGAFVGFVGFPLLFWLAALVGRTIRCAVGRFWGAGKCGTPSGEQGPPLSH